jgi:soluble epoxide hydrolase / lipid-phosphate phosphatase
MESLERKTFQTSRSYSYEYLISPGSENQALLLLHGFPSNALLFEDVVPHLLKLPYRIVVPNLLGTPGTSIPEDSAAYSSKEMSNDMMEILDHEKIDQLIPIGHDMGSWFAQRVYVFNKPRCKALILLSVAYMPPNTGPLAEPLTLEKFLGMTEEVSGYARYDYFRLFLSLEAPQIMRDHAESLFTLIYAEEKGAIRKYYCEKDAFRSHLQADNKLPVKDFAKKPGRREAFVDRIQKHGIQGALLWYHAIIDGTQFEAEKEVTPEDVLVSHPSLFIGCADDAVARTDAIEPVRPLMADLTVKELDCAHYCTYEKPDEVAQEIVRFIEEKRL